MLLPIGSILILVGAIWLVVVAIQTGQTTAEKIIWAVVNLICQPVGGIIFYAVKRQGLIPLLLVIIGCVIFFLSGGMNAYTNMAPVTP